jgi:kynurenine formamidase
MPLPDELQELARRVSNWGRWGPDDERGTLNLIDAAAVRRGVACVRKGVAFSLAIPFDADGPQLGTIPGRVNPIHTVTAVNLSFTGDADDFTTSDDRVDLGVQAATHWDTLAHVGYGGLLYNGVPNSVVTEGEGATRLGVEAIGPVTSRGIVLDVARALGDDPLPGGHPISAADLDAALELAGIVPEPGDVALVRTGQLAVLRAGDKKRFMMKSPGLSTKSIEWFHDHQWAAVAIDTLPFECYPYEDPAVMLPVHMIQLRDMGLLQGQLWDLDPLAIDCASDGAYGCLLVANPVPLTHGIGGIVAPVAVK